MVMIFRFSFYIVLLLALGGCQEETIRVHRVPKPPTPTYRTIAVVIPLPDATWFLKITGQADEVTADEADFRRFSESVSFAKDPAINWKLPESWKSETPGPMTFAAFRTNKGILVTISQLGPGQKLLDNVNRWRGQIGLKPINESEMANVIKSVTIAGVASTWVDLTNSGTN
jgi:hypothetical protein